MNPLRGIVHTIHAIPESLMLRNLGVDAEIEESQAAVLCLVVAGFWFWLFRRTPAVHPLVAAGAACAIVSYLLIYTARGYLPFSSLRTTPWYQTLPHFGAILFVCGLLHGRCVSGSARPITARGILGAALFSVLFLTAQKPIADRLFQNETLPGLHRARFNGFATPEGFIEFVSWHVAENAAAEQRRVLARLDRIETICWQLGISDQALRDLFGSPRFPGLPVELNPWQILNLPRHSVADRNTVNHSLGWVVEEHEVTHLALRPLLESLEAPDPPTRTAAVISLGLLGPAAEPALKPIMERLSDPSPITRMHAASAIKQIDPGTAAKLGLN